MVGEIGGKSKSLHNGTSSLSLPQICGEEYVVWGVSVPQTSVPPDLLLTSALRVGVAASGRGILGHISVDFVTFINPTTVSIKIYTSMETCSYSIGVIRRVTSFNFSVGAGVMGSGP